MTTYEEFTAALDFLVSIEPDPASFDDMDDYDAIMAPHETRIEQAHATIRAYGGQLTDRGAAHMQSVLYEFVHSKTDPKAHSVILSVVNTEWDGLGGWVS